MTAWLPVETVARLLPQQPTPRHVRRLVTGGHFGDRVQRDGRSIRIAVDALPSEARARYYAEHPHLLPHPAIASDQPGRTQKYENATASQRERAERRRAAVTAWLVFLAEWGARPGITRAKERWCAGYRQTHPEIGALSVDSIERWTSRFELDGIDGLVDGNDGHGRRGQTVIPREALGFFRARFLDKDAPPTVARAIEDTRLAADEYGWSLPPTDDAFYRAARKIPSAVRLARRDAVDEPSKLLPYVQRRAEAPYLTLQSDHHIADVFVHCEGQICGGTECRGGHRPWWTPMFDVGSRKVISWQISLAVPNSQRILRAFRLAVEAEGLPRQLYIDNGKDFKKAAGKALRETEQVLGNRMRALGIKTVFARPYNAQAKAIERFFGTFVTRRWQGSEAYAGRLGKRSERTQYLCKHPELLPRFSEFVGLLEDAIAIYNTTPHRGEGMNGRSPSEVFATGRIARRDPHTTAFRLVFWDRHERVLDRNGVRINGFTYTPVDPTGEIFTAHFRARLIVLVDPSDLSRAILCNEQEQFLCEARALELATHDTADAVTQAALEAVHRSRKAIRRSIAGEVDGESLTRLRWFKTRYREIFHRHAERRREQETQFAAAVGAEHTPATVFLPVYSRLSRDAETFRNDLPRLTDAQSELAMTAEDHTDEYLDDLLPRRPQGGRPIEPAGDDDDPVHLAAERDRLAAIRERQRKEREDECLDCSEPVWAGHYCETHFRPSDDE